MARLVLTADAEIEGLKAAVARHFSVYGVVVSPIALTFQVEAPGDTLDARFDALRQELVPQNYIPSVTRERGETLVHVQRRPTSRFARREVNAAMLFVTILTTVFFGGAYNWAAYSGAPILSLQSIGWGAVFFSIPLLTILGAHEMGHYLVAKRYKVRASLPFFLPSFPPLGTFGAFISMRDPIPNRRALLDIGVSGPLIGFVIAIPVTLAGLALSTGAPPVDASSAVGGELIQPSALFALLSLFFPLPDTFVMHPMAFAGWVGLFVTAINLLPAGQLDGGHVARALLGDRQHYLSWAAVLALFVMSTFYFGWIIFAFLILMIGVRHPPPLNDLTRLSVGRKLIGIGAVVVLLITFIPQPFVLVEAGPGITFENLAREPISRIVGDISVGGTAVLMFAVNNTGGVREQVRLTVNAPNLYAWSFRFGNLTIERTNTSRTTLVNADNATFTLNSTERAVVELILKAPAVLNPVPPRVEFTVQGRVLGDITTQDLDCVLNLV